ncbi:hypothetical protein [Streptomyces sp. NPDC047000]|uniref:hypothetical protein n=1 Tax=Streptomyces sp. NPDC047000 TaxID=3155474 RepID=UPI0033DE4CC2
MSVVRPRAAIGRRSGAQEETDVIRSSARMPDGLEHVERHAWSALSALSAQTGPTGLYDGTTANAAGRAYREVS